MQQGEITFSTIDRAPQYRDNRLHLKSPILILAVEPEMTLRLQIQLQS